MKKNLVKLLMLSTLLCTLATPVFADSQKILTLGADLTTEQRQVVLDFYGITEEDLKTIDVIEITNADEHRLLDNYLDSSIIGKHTYSCCLIEPTTSGGINIKTANLNYVTINSLYNALQTAGIENCNVVVTAPFDVSGTGALTGVFKAFEETDVVLDEDKESLATEELVVGAELENTYGTESMDLVKDLKEAIVGSDITLSEEDIYNIVKEKAEEYNINLTDEDINTLVQLLNKFQNIDYSVDDFKSDLNKFVSTVKEKYDEAEESGFIDKVVEFFKKIFEFFKGIFGGTTVPTTLELDENQSIFDNINTDIFTYDEESIVNDSNTLDQLENILDE